MTTPSAFTSQPVSCRRPQEPHLSPIHYPRPRNRYPVNTDRGLRARSSPHLASPPRHGAFPRFAWVVRPGVPAPAGKDGHIDAPTSLSA